MDSNCEKFMWSQYAKSERKKEIEEERKTQKNKERNKEKERARNRKRKGIGRKDEWLKGKSITKSRKEEKLKEN